MDTVTVIFKTLLSFLLQLATLIVNFFISTLTLFLDFFRNLVGLAS